MTRYYTRPAIAFFNKVNSYDSLHINKSQLLKLINRMKELRGDTSFEFRMDYYCDSIGCIASVANRITVEEGWTHCERGEGIIRMFLETDEFVASVLYGIYITPVDLSGISIGEVIVALEKLLNLDNTIDGIKEFHHTFSSVRVIE